MNRNMFQICQNLAGRDIQNITELEEALGHPLKENVFYDVDLKVYCFADGSVWKFSEKEIITTAGDHFFQVLASEVSELYRNKVLLKEENQKLQEMSVAMKELSKNVITLTREEEMLSMKMRVHDNLGYSVLAAQRMLLRESEADRDVFLSQWKQQTDIMMARSISLSEDITKELNQCLTDNGKTFSNLNDNPQLIMDLEAALYPSLKSALDVKYCSGVFVVLDATVNTKTEYADTSRMGIYLRLSDLKAVNTSKQHVAFFRGNADIARAEHVQLHNRWNLEFDTSALSGYEQIMQFDGNRLVESCLWTDRLELSDTWEDVQLLYVPVLDSTGKVRGLCGMEMSNLYFRLSYPMVEGSCGNIVTVLAPVDKKGNIYLDKAMFGDTKETYLSPSGTMTVKKGKYYNTYSTAFGNYIGRHELLGLKSCNGMPLAVLTLISEANYEKLTADNRRDWIIGTLLFLILLLVVSVGMSHRFVKPILRSLKALQEDTLTDENLSGISEVDALVDFMQKKRNTEKLENGGIPPNIEEMLKAFALRVETLTPSERMVLQYYVDGYTIQEIASLLYISIGTARKHNTNMNRKLGITVREELMLYIELFRKCNQLDKLTYSRTE